MNLDLKYYTKIFLRRSPLFFTVAALFTSLGLVVALILPPEYEARAVLLVESEQIPEELAPSTVQTQLAEQVEIIQQRLMSRENLLDVADRLDIYPPNPELGRPAATEIVDDMRARTRFATSTRKGGATFVNVSFRGKTASKSAEVTNEFVTLMLEENVELRTAQAGDTLQFFEQEVERLGAALDAQSARLVSFQNEAGIAVPANLGYLRGRLSDLQGLVIGKEREIATLNEQKARITELFELTGRVAGAADGRSPLERRLQEARQALADAQLVYSDQNPKLNILEARVAQLEEQMAAEMVGEQTPAEAATPEALFQAQIGEIDSRIEGLKDDIVEARAEIEEVEDHIDAVPENGIRLDKLQRDFNNIQAQYNKASARLSAAATGERIELLAKGQRISVIEQAVPPPGPSRPNRPLIALAGAGSGIFAGLGLIVLLEFLNRSIRRPVELTSRLGITPIGVLPYIRTDREVRTKRAMLMALVLLLVVVVPLAVYAVHSFVTPIDALLEPVANRLGFSIAG